MTSRPEPMTATRRRALKTWQVLIARASNRQTITYGELARVIGNEVPPPALGRYLDLVADFCQVRGVPDLTLVVIIETGQLGKVREGVDVDEQREAVYRQGDWYAMTPPTPADFLEDR